MGRHEWRTGPASSRARIRRPALLVRNGRGVAVWILGAACGRVGGSCGRPEPPRGDADQTLEVTAELALVREAGVGGHLRQGEVTALLEEVLGPLDAAGDDVLVRRQPDSRLELPREVVGAEAGHPGHLVQPRAGLP